jgi:methionyl-tRNA synthetase
MGYGGLNLPYDVPANEFLNIGGGKLSTSRNRAIWLPDYLERYDPDTLRYVLSVGMPETKDSDFSWDVFVHRNNDELVANYGNLAHRVLTFTQHHFNGVVPMTGEPDEQSQELLQKASVAMDNVDKALCRCSFREAIRCAMSLAQETNRFLDSQAPWKTIKEDTEAAANSVYTALCVLSVLKTILYPFLPFSSEKLHTFLGFEGSVKESGWIFQSPLPGRKLCQPQPLFVKLDESVIEEENSRLGNLSS